MKNVTNSSSTAILARLLATENLTVTVDAKAPTAAFDLKTRTLILPNWENVGQDVQHLLVGHEVGHALYTTEEGWHNALDTRGGAFKSFLNVVEDARIEKKIKRKYPGLRKDFQSAYKYLFEQDFFGIRDESIEDQILIDRVNLFFKLGTHIKVKFSKVEQPLVDAVANAETWEQVVTAAQALFDYCKKEQQEKKNQPKEEGESEDEDYLDDMFGDDSEDEGEDEEEDESGEESEESDGESDEEDSSGSSDEDTEASEDEGEVDNNGKGATDSDEDGEPESKTDKAFRDREGSLASTTPINVLTLPTCDYRKLMITNDNFHKYMQDANPECYTAGTHEYAYLNRLVSEFTTSSKGIIDLYVKEFQMRKSAASWKKARISDTGDINASKLAYYKLTDQVFKSRTIVPNGKNHGMVMLLDLSGSMADNFLESANQVMVLATFCKRVGIPFQVLGFTENNWSRGGYFGDDGAKWTRNPYEISLEAVTLVELLTSDMKPNQFQASIRDLVLYAETIDRMQSYRRYRPANVSFSTYIPSPVGLGSTPLVEALALCRQILPEFQKRFRVEVLNFVVVTDGEGDNTTNCWKNHSEYGIVRGNVETNDAGERARMKVRIGKNMYDLANRRDIDKVILKSIKDEFSANILGFFLVERGRWKSSTYRQVGSLATKKDGTKDEMNLIRDKIRGDGFYESYAVGFDRYFIVTATEAEEIQVEAGASKAKIKNAFSKNGRNKKLNKVLASKFMDIAA